MKNARFILVGFLSFQILFAEAQYDGGASADIGAGYGQIALSQSILNNTSDLNNKTKKVNVSFNYYGIKDAELYKYKNELSKQIAAKQKNGNPDKIFDYLTGIEYTFNNKVRSYGLSTFNISDRMATYVAWAWELYHHKQSSIQKINNLNSKIMANMASPENERKLKAMLDQDKSNWLLNYTYNVAIAADYAAKETADKTIIADNNSSLAAEAQKINVNIKDASLFE